MFVFVSKFGVFVYFNFTKCIKIYRILKQLHKILKPFMLRRLKSDVEKDLLPKVETLLYTGFSGTILFKL